MSDAKEISLLDQIKTQYAQFVAQRDQIQINFQQLVGAITACEIMIKQHEQNNLMKESEDQLSKTLEKQEHGETIEQKQEQIA